VIIEISDDAQEDLLEGFEFYEGQLAGVGFHFLNSLFSDIDSLTVTGGIHPLVDEYHRALSRRFPFAIYYSVDGERVRVHAVLDCRRNPAWIRRRLRGPK
jgi:hypothetical protein